MSAFSRIILYFLFSPLIVISTIQVAFGDGDINLTETKHPFIQLEGGWYKPSFKGPILVNNGSFYSDSMQYDRYSAQKHDKLMMAMTAGFLFDHSTQWLPQSTVGLRIQHFSKQKLDGAVWQYSLPEFYNYDYQWNVAATTLMAVARFLIYQRYQWAPYLSLGAGVAMIDGSQYQEQALPGLSSRFDPGFINHQYLSFTYSIGAGLNYILNQSIQLSMGYTFQDLGKVYSGPGVGQWAQHRLNLGRYKTNIATVGLTYSFDRSQS